MLEGPGHEKRASILQRAFRRSSKPFRNRRPFRWLVWRVRDLALFSFGIAVGAVAMIFVDYAGLPATKNTATEASLYYSNCREAIRAGVAPIHFGQPGYRPPLDADGDGVACEPYPGR